MRADSVGERFRAYAAVIIGSRHILIREMDHKGEWTGGWRLIQKELGGKMEEEE